MVRYNRYNYTKHLNTHILHLSSITLSSQEGMSYSWKPLIIISKGIDKIYKQSTKRSHALSQRNSVFKSRK